MSQDTLPERTTDEAPRPSPGRRLALGRVRTAEILLLFLLVQAAAIVAGVVFSDRFAYLSSANVSVLLKTVPVLGVLALGVGVLMIAGEFDLSVGANYTFSAVVLAKLVTEQSLNPFAATLIALAVGTGIGIVNGLVTLRFAIPSFIVTLGAMLFWQGAVLAVHGASSVRLEQSQAFRDLLAGRIGPLEAPFLWLLALAAVVWVLVHRHLLGNRIYAVGGNVNSARAVGIDPAKVKMFAFAFAGACAAFAGILAAARVGSIQPGQGSGLELQAIAACVIGGLALSGGRGTVLGLTLGAALMITIQDILLLVRAPGFYLDLFVGVLIVGAAIFNRLSARGSVTS